MVHNYGSFSPIIIPLAKAIATKFGALPQVMAVAYPILRQNISSYVHQLELAISRRDSVSIIHRII